MTGATLKQMARAQFWDALTAYKTALASKDSAAIVATSLRIHAARGADGVPKHWGKYVRDTYNNAGKQS